MNLRSVYGLIALATWLCAPSAFAMPRVGINGAACAFDTIAEAIVAASSEDQIFISEGDYFEQPGLVAKSLSFRPGGADCSASVSSSPPTPTVSITTFGGLGGLFQIDSVSAAPIDVSFRGIRFTSAIGENGGLISVDNANVGLFFSELSLGTAEFGGCVYVAGGSLNVFDTTFNDCTASEDGGAVYVLNGGLTINRSEVLSSDADSGGGVFVARTEDRDEALSIYDSLFQSNSADREGGALNFQGSINSFDKMFISGATFSNNTAVTRGGAIFSVNVNALSIVESQISGNRTTATVGSSSDGGAGVGAIASTVSLSDVDLLENVSGFNGGGLLASFSSVVEVIGGQVIDNRANAGGGMYFGPCSLTMEDVVVSGNEATDGNGGGLSATLCDLAISASTFEQNQSSVDGGGAHISFSDGRIDNTRFLNNEAASDGGGIAISQGSNLTIRSVATGSDPCSGSQLSANTYCSEFRDNNVQSQSGGAIFISRNPSAPERASTVLVEGTAMIGNYAPANGTHVSVSAAGITDGDRVDTLVMRNVLIQRGEFVSGGITYPETLYFGERVAVTLDSVTVATNPGAALLAEGPDTTLDLRSTLFWDNADPSFASLTTTEVTSECAFSEPEVMGSWNLGSTLDPQFVDDPDRGALRLDPLTSPVLDACDSGPPEDLDGFGRVQGAGWEPGAFEVSSNPVVLIRVSPASGLVTGENGDGDTIEVMLAKAPLDDVIIDVTSSQTNEASVDVAMLTFTPANWSVPQTLNVSGVDDNANDGNQAFQIRIGPSVSDDPAFDNLDLIVVPGINVDDDSDLPDDLIFMNGFDGS